MSGWLMRVVGRLRFLCPTSSSAPPTDDLAVGFLVIFVVVIAVVVARCCFSIAGPVGNTGIVVLAVADDIVGLSRVAGLVLLVVGVVRAGDTAARIGGSRQTGRGAEKVFVHVDIEVIRILTAGLTPGSRGSGIEGGNGSYAARRRTILRTTLRE